MHAGACAADCFNSEESSVRNVCANRRMPTPIQIEHFLDQLRVWKWIEFFNSVKNLSFLEFAQCLKNRLKSLERRFSRVSRDSKFLVKP